MNVKKFVLKILLVNMSMIIKFEDFYFDHILIDQKSQEKILIYDILYRTFVQNRC